MYLPCRNTRYKANMNEHVMEQMGVLYGVPNLRCSTTAGILSGTIEGARTARAMSPCDLQCEDS